MPVPSSLTRISCRPPSSMARSIDVAPASSAFSTSSLTTEAGRSITSPAAIVAATDFGRTRIGAWARVRAESTMASSELRLPLEEPVDCFPRRERGEIELPKVASHALGGVGTGLESVEGKLVWRVFLGHMTHNFEGFHGVPISVDPHFTERSQHRLRPVGDPRRQAGQARNLDPVGAIGRSLA